MRPAFLTDSQIEHFIEKGYIILRGGIPRDFAEAWGQRAFDRLGYDRNDKSTWAKERVHQPSREFADVSKVAPDFWAATCDLVGEDRIKRPFNIGDGFISNLGTPDGEEPREWIAPGPNQGGWHKDGDFFRHFLDSPEQGLLTICLWTSMVAKGGATFIAPDSVGVIARCLAQHPEGLTPSGFKFGELIKECKEFVELTGEPGDVVLHHPYMLHTASYNAIRAERVITNPPVHLKEPMNFNRENAEDLSPLELAVLHGLGVDRYDFKPTAERERIVPARIAMQQKLLEEEQAREAAKAGT